jgi:hypothetical protein
LHHRRKEKDYGEIKVDRKREMEEKLKKLKELVEQKNKKKEQEKKFERK